MNKGNDLQPNYAATLPSGWRWAQLGEVCLPSPGTRDPRREPDETFRYVDISGVNNFRKRITEARTICGKDAPSRARQVIRSGDVIVATTRPNLNAVALISNELDGEICSTGFCVLRPREELSSDFLFAFTQSQEFVKALSELVKGALYPAVTDSQVRAQLIPLPPLSEQKRIAVILGEQMATVEQARAAVAAQANAAKKLPSALLYATFTAPEFQQWPTRKLGDVLRLRKDIIHPRNNPSGKAQFVGLEHVQSVTGRRLGALPVEMSKLTGRKPQFFHGDIVYGYLRPYLNKVWIAEFDGLCSVDQYVYTVNTDVADSRFVAWFMRSPVYLSAAPISTTPGQLPRIRTEEVASVPFALPPLSRQRDIVQRLEAELGDAQQLADSLEASLKAVQQLPAMLLRQAFSGQLSQSPAFRTRRATVVAPTFDVRGAVSSYIVNRLYDQPSFGNIQHQKLLFLAEAHVGLDLGGVYYREKWGPHEGLDFYRLNGRGQWAEKRDVFRLRKRQGLRGYTYTVGANIREQVAMAEAALGERKVALDALLDLFAPMTTDQAEMYATLFAAWNDFLIAGHTPSDAEIIQEFRENWHERKQKFTPDQLRDALTFMRAHQLVPRGIGPATRIKN